MKKMYSVLLFAVLFVGCPSSDTPDPPKVYPWASISSQEAAISSSEIVNRVIGLSDWYDPAIYVEQMESSSSRHARSSTVDRTKEQAVLDYVFSEESLTVQAYISDEFVPDYETHSFEDLKRWLDEQGVAGTDRIKIGYDVADWPDIVTGEMQAGPGGAVLTEYEGFRPAVLDWDTGNHRYFNLYADAFGEDQVIEFLITRSGIRHSGVIGGHYQQFVCYLISTRNALVMTQTFTYMVEDTPDSDGNAVIRALRLDDGTLVTDVPLVGTATDPFPN